MEKNIFVREENALRKNLDIRDKVLNDLALKLEKIELQSKPELEQIE